MIIICKPLLPIFSFYFWSCRSIYFPFSFFSSFSATAITLWSVSRKLITGQWCCCCWLWCICDQQVKIFPAKGSRWIKKGLQSGKLWAGDRSQSNLCKQKMIQWTLKKKEEGKTCLGNQPFIFLLCVLVCLPTNVLITPFQFAWI